MKLTTIEAARGIAASIVVLYHVSRHFLYDTGVMPFGSIFQFGHSGVDFFFVLSGFVIFLVHEKDIGVPQASAKYIHRRTVRIYPIFWFVFSLWFCAILIANKPTPQLDVDLIFDFLLLSRKSIVDVSWFLRHEILFYTFFLLLILRREIGFLQFYLDYVYYRRKSIGVYGRIYFFKLV